MGKSKFSGLQAKFLISSFIRLKTMDPIYFRLAERMLIVFAGILCIVLGYLLFSKTYGRKESTAGEFSAQAGGLTLSIKQLWPGVFFAAFGMAILVVCEVSTIKFPDSVTKTGEGLVLAMGNRLPDDTLTKLTKAIQDSTEVLEMDLKDAPQGSLLSIRRSALESSRNALVDVAYGDGALALFQERAKQFKLEPTAYEKMSVGEKQKFEKIRALLKL
jgi:hypothetical protein